MGARAIPPAAVIYQREMILARRGPHAAPDHLQVHGERASRAGELDALDGRQVNAIGGEEHIADDFGGARLEPRKHRLSGGFVVFVCQELRRHPMPAELLHECRGVRLIAGEHERALAVREPEPVLAYVPDELGPRH